MSDILHYSVADGVRLTTVKNSYFKKDRLSVNILLPLKKEIVAENALLVGVLSHSSEKYPDLLSINRALAEMYGAKLVSGVTRIGEIQVIRLSITSVKDRFLPVKEDLSIKCLEFLLSLLLSPSVKDNAFTANDVEVEKSNLIDNILGSINDKRVYANERLIAEMCKGEAYGIKETGEIDDVKAVTPESLYAAYKRVISSARIEFFSVGETDGEKLSQTISKAFEGLDRNVDPFPLTDPVYNRSEEKQIIEEMTVEQAKLAIGLRTGVTAHSKEYLPLILANAIFGSGVSSKLFLVVREQMHLCYYCSSRLDAQKGLMLIQCGVDKSNFEKAVAAITDQLNAVKQGDFTDEDISASLLSLQNSYRSVSDSPASIESWYLRGLVSGSDAAPEEIAEQLASVTRDEIIEAISKTYTDTVYLLKGRDEE